jgi:hypothetical protein
MGPDEDVFFFQETFLWRLSTDRYDFVSFAVAGPSQGSQHPSLNAAALFNEGENELAYNLLGSRKRPREGDDTLVIQWQRQQNHIPNAAEYNQQQTYGSGATMGVPQTTGVSTGLHLAFEDERINSTTSASTSERADASRSVLFAVGEDLNTQLQQQREEIEQFFKMQVQHFELLFSEFPRSGVC